MKRQARNIQQSHIQEGIATALSHEKSCYEILWEENSKPLWRLDARLLAMLKLWGFTIRKGYTPFFKVEKPPRALATYFICSSKH